MPVHVCRAGTQSYILFRAERILGMPGFRLSKPDPCLECFKNSNACVQSPNPRQTRHHVMRATAGRGTTAAGAAGACLCISFGTQAPSCSPPPPRLQCPHSLRGCCPPTSCSLPQLWPKCDDQPPATDTHCAQSRRLSHHRGLLPRRAGALNHGVAAPPPRWLAGQANAPAAHGNSRRPAAGARQVRFIFKVREHGLPRSSAAAGCTSPASPCLARRARGERARKKQNSYWREETARGVACASVTVFTAELPPRAVPRALSPILRGGCAAGRFSV